MLHLIIIHFFGLLTPGPDFFYVSKIAASNSRRNALCGVIGITLGVTIWAMASILGLALLLNTYKSLHGIIMILGGGYLTYLGILMVKSRKNVVFAKATTEELNQSSTISKEIFKGLLINLSNAKVVIYFSSVMSLVLVNLTESWQIFTALLIIIVETFIYFYIISLLFSHKLAKDFYSKYSRYIDNVAGIIFLGFGLYLVYSGLQEFGSV